MCTKCCLIWLFSEITPVINTNEKPGSSFRLTRLQGFIDIHCSTLCTQSTQWTPEIRHFKLGIAHIDSLRHVLVAVKHRGVCKQISTIQNFDCRHRILSSVTWIAFKLFYSFAGAVCTWTYMLVTQVDNTEATISNTFSETTISI